MVAVAIVGQIFSFGVASTLIGIYTIFLIHCLFIGWDKIPQKDTVATGSATVVASAVVLLESTSSLNPWGNLGWVISLSVFTLVIASVWKKGKPFPLIGTIKLASLLVGISLLYLTFLTPNLWWAVLINGIALQAFFLPETEKEQMNQFLWVFICCLAVALISTGIQFEIWNPVSHFFLKYWEELFWTLFLSGLGVQIFLEVKKQIKNFKEKKERNKREAQQKEQRAQLEKEAAQRKKEEERRKEEEKKEREEREKRAQQILEKGGVLSWNDLYFTKQALNIKHSEEAILHHPLTEGVVTVSFVRNNLIFDEGLFKFAIESLAKVIRESKEDENVKKAIARIDELKNYSSFKGYEAARKMSFYRLRDDWEFFQRFFPFIFKED